MLQDRFRGCLIGGGIGDALGYPVEFMRLSAIKSAYGANGLQDLVLEKRFSIVLVLWILLVLVLVKSV